MRADNMMQNLPPTGCRLLRSGDCENSKRRTNQEIVLDDYVLTQPPVLFAARRSR